MGPADDFGTSLVHEQALPALDGADVGVDLPDFSQKVELLPVDGLETAGDSALRNSV